MATMKISFLVICLVVCINIGYNGGVGAARLKRDSVREFSEDMEESLEEAQKGSSCVTDDDCMFFQYCEHSFDILKADMFRCRLHQWFLWGAVGVGAFIILSILVSCLCCPCCCLYAICRKSS